MKSTLKYLLYGTALLLPLAHPAAAQGELTGSAAPFTGSVNLSTEGTADWAHWGLNTPTDFDHKTGANLISNVTQIGSFPVSRLGDNLALFTWTDGTPDEAATNTNSGIFTGGFTTDEGFSFTVPADKSVRTLRVYVGGYNAGGTLTAHLSDGSAVDYVDSSVGSAGIGSTDGSHFYAVYTFVYEANAANQTLTISWVDSTDTTPAGNASFTNVSLEAASLVNGLITAPAAPTGLVASAGLTTISLTWNGVPGATSYNVKRATTSGGPYTTIATTGSTTYADVTATFGTPYYYVVSAVNSIGESGNSNQAIATVTSTLIASDNAGDPAYAGGWNDGTNGGTGFQPWVQTVVANNGGAGFFTYTSTSNGAGGGASIDTNGNSFGLYGYNSTDGGVATATRSFNVPLAAGQAFLLDFDNGYIDDGSDGFNLIDASGNTLFGFFFAGGTGDYQITDSAGTTVTTLPYTYLGLHTTFLLTSATTYTFTATNLVDGSNISVNGTLAGSGPVTGVAIYDSHAGGGGDHNLYANNLAIVAPSGATVNGKVILQGDLAQATQDVTFTFVPTGGGSPLVKTTRTAADGTFSITGIPTGTYNLGIKSAKTLRITYTNVTVSASGLTIADTTLFTGDATNDNSVDVGDFGILVNSYGGDVTVSGSGYDPAADFNDDGSVDIGDFGLLVNNYGLLGDDAP